MIVFKTLSRRASWWWIIAAAGSLVLILLLFPLYQLDPNRVVKGEAVFLRNLFSPASHLIWAIAAAAFFVSILFAASFPILFAGAVMLLLWTLPALLSNAGTIPPGYRVSPASGFWLLHVVLLFHGILMESSKRHTIISWIALALLAAIAIPFQGSSTFSIFIEFRAQKNRLVLELMQHLKLSGLSLSAALLISIPLGILSAKKAWAQWLYSLTGILQTIPSLALFGLLMVPYSLLSLRFPILRTWGISGIGMAPAITALALYALLPLMTGIREGLRSVPEQTLQAGRGLGFSSWGLFWKVELPLALPLVMAGFRTAVVQNLGNAALAPLIGAGGLGFFIFQGIGQTSSDMVLLGVFPLLILTLGADAMLGKLQSLPQRRHDNANSLV